MQDEVNQDYSEQNEVDGMKKGADLSANFNRFCPTDGQTDRQTDGRTGDSIAR